MASFVEILSHLSITLERSNSNPPFHSTTFVAKRTATINAKVTRIMVIIEIKTFRIVQQIDAKHGLSDESFFLFGSAKG